MIKIGRLKWLEHLFRIQETDPCRKLTLLKPEDTRLVGKPKLRWFESGEEDLKNMGVRNWTLRTENSGGQFERLGSTNDCIDKGRIRRR